MFFHTIIMNSHFKDKIYKGEISGETINDHLQYINWSNKGSAHPAVIRKKDIGALEKSEKLFARKFDETIDYDILDLIDKQIKNSSI